MIQANQVERRRRGGFTLLEVLIVMAIIIVIMSLGGVYAFRAFEDGNKKAAKAKAYALGNAAQIYYTNYKSFPETLQQLVSPPDGHEPYVDPATLIDPWGKEFQYDSTGAQHNKIKPDVWTTSKDGIICGNWE